jgi:hypothetical protein
MDDFLPSLTIKNIPVILDVNVKGRFNYTGGIFSPGGNYFELINEVARLYGVDPTKVKLEIKRGSIIVEYQINGVPSNDPPPSEIADAIANIIKNDRRQSTKLVFNNNDTSCTFTLTGKSTTSLTGTVNSSGVGFNYTTPGTYEVKIPPGYTTMMVILAGGGGAGTPSLANSAGPSFIGIRGGPGSPGGLIAFKIPIRSASSKFIINVGKGGVGSRSFPPGFVQSTQGEHSSIELLGRTIGLAQGGGSNAVWTFYPSGGTPRYDYALNAIGSAYGEAALISNGRASNGGLAGPVEPPFAKWEAAKTGGYGRDEGKDGYCTLLFDKTTTVPSLTRGVAGLPESKIFTYVNPGSYTLPLLKYYRMMRVTLIGGGGGATIGGLGGNARRLTFEIPTNLIIPNTVNIVVGEGGERDKNVRFVGISNQLDRSPDADWWNPTLKPVPELDITGKPYKIWLTKRVSIGGTGGPTSISAAGFHVAAGGGQGGDFNYNRTPRANWWRTGGSEGIITSSLIENQNTTDLFQLYSGADTYWDSPKGNGLAGKCVIEFFDYAGFEAFASKIRFEYNVVTKLLSYAFVHEIGYDVQSYFPLVIKIYKQTFEDFLPVDYSNTFAKNLTNSFNDVGYYFLYSPLFKIASNTIFLGPPIKTYNFNNQTSEFSSRGTNYISNGTLVFMSFFLKDCSCDFYFTGDSGQPITNIEWIERSIRFIFTVKVYYDNAVDFFLNPKAVLTNVTADCVRVSVERSVENFDNLGRRDNYNSVTISRIPRRSDGPLIPTIELRVESLDGTMNEIISIYPSSPDGTLAGGGSFIMVPPPGI